MNEDTSNNTELKPQMDKPIRDFNPAAHVLLGLSMIAVFIALITKRAIFKSYGYMGISYVDDTIIIETLIDVLIIVAGILTFGKKRFGLISLTLLFITRMFATIQWSSDISIAAQLGEKTALLLRDFGFFAIAMCFPKNGISGWKSMLASEKYVAEHTIFPVEESPTSDDEVAEGEKSATTTSQEQDEKMEVEQLHSEEENNSEVSKKCDLSQTQDDQLGHNGNRRILKSLLISVLSVVFIICGVLLLRSVIAHKNVQSTAFDDNTQINTGVNLQDETSIISNEDLIRNRSNMTIVYSILKDEKYTDLGDNFDAFASMMSLITNRKLAFKLAHKDDGKISFEDFDKTYYPATEEHLKKEKYRHWFYEELMENGIAVGDYKTFCLLLCYENDLKNFYNKGVEAGLNLGSYDSYRKSIR